MKTMPAEKVTTKTENRRSNKPLMEKRRRARINHSLSELKNLILDAIKKDSNQSSKLEKADILEMAVRHLQNLQKQQTTETRSGNKYRAGFNECATEVTRFLETAEGVDATVRSRLVNHLFNCLNKLCSTESPDHVQNSADSTSKSDNTVESTAGEVATSSRSSPLTVPSVEASSTDPSTAILPKPSEAAAATTTTIVHGLQLIPTRLPNGEIAFVVPNPTLRPSTADRPPVCSASTPPLSISDRGTCLLMPASHVISSADSSLPTPTVDNGSRGQRPLVPVTTTTACQTSPLEDTKSDRERSSDVPHVQEQSRVDGPECVWRPW